MYRHYDVLEGQLRESGGKSILPGGFSAVGIYWYPWVNQYNYAGCSLDLYPLVNAWYEEGEMEAVERAHEQVPQGKMSRGS